MPLTTDDVLASLGKVVTTDPKVQANLTAATNQFKQFAQEQDAERNRLIASQNQDQTTISQLQATNSSLQQTTAQQARQIADLTAKLDAAAPGVTSTTPLNVANSFKTVVDTIQAQARQTPGVATTVKSMDIEVKGLVQVQPDQSTLLMLPAPGSPIDPNMLSTLRVSFAAVPVAAPAAPSAAGAAPPTTGAAPSKPTRPTGGGAAPTSPTSPPRPKRTRPRRRPAS